MIPWTSSAALLPTNGNVLTLVDGTSQLYITSINSITYASYTNNPPLLSDVLTFKQQVKVGNFVLQLIFNSSSGMIGYKSIPRILNVYMPDTFFSLNVPLGTVYVLYLSYYTVYSTIDLTTALSSTNTTIVDDCISSLDIKTLYKKNSIINEIREKLLLNPSFLKDIYITPSDEVMVHGSIHFINIPAYWYTVHLIWNS
jgi:hypothetical protein